MSRSQRRPPKDSFNVLTGRFWVKTSIRVAGRDEWLVNGEQYRLTGREVGTLVKLGFTAQAKFNMVGDVLWVLTSWTPRAGAWVLDI